MTGERERRTAGGTPPRAARSRRAMAALGSLLVHVLVLTLAAIGLGKPSLFSPAADDRTPFVVDLVAPDPKRAMEAGAADTSADTATPAPTEDQSAKAPVVRPPAPPTVVRARSARLPPPEVQTVAVSASDEGTGDGAALRLGEAQLAGATFAGSGVGGGRGDASGGGSAASVGPGGVCDMAARVQTALRANAEVRRTVGEAHRTLVVGRGALLMWNGDWVQAPGQAGKGLAGVRQAIALEVAFAPPACRTQSVRGLVVLSLGDGPGQDGGGARLALGRASWKWSDLLGL